MLTTDMCPYHAPCGLCTYYDKPCKEVCNTNRHNNKDKANCEHYTIANGNPICLGTREMDSCSCEGNRNKCNFYKNKV